MKVLIVDDSKAMQVIIQRSVNHLPLENIEYRFAFNGQEALDVIGAWQPDLIIIDWHMPVLDGFELLATLNREMIPVRLGFITTESSQERLQSALKEGAEFILNKPFETEELLSVLQPIVDDILKDKEQADEAGAPVEENRSGDNENTNRIILPRSTTLESALDALCRDGVSIREVEQRPLTEKLLPSAVGLFVDVVDGVVHGICVTDVIASTVLSGQIKGISVKELKKSLATPVLDDDVIKQLQRACKVMSVTFYDTVTNSELVFKKLSTINTDIQKLEALISRRNIRRVDFDVSFSGLPTGKMIVVGSR